MDEKVVWRRVNRLAVVTILTGIVFMLLGGVLHGLLGDMATESAIMEIDLRVAEYQRTVENMLERTVQMLDTLSCFVSPWENADTHEIVMELKQANQRNDFAAMAYFPVDDAGNVIVTRDGGSYIGLPLSSLADEVQQAVQSAWAGERAISDIYEGSLLVLPEGEEGLLYAVPVESNGQIVAALAASDDAHVLTAAGGSNAPGNPGYILHIVDSEGRVLVYSETRTFDQHIENVFDTTYLSETEEAALYEAMQGGEIAHTSFSNQGREYYIEMAPVGINDWYVLCVSDAETVNSPMRSLTSILQVGVGAALALLMILLGYYYSLLRKSNREAMRLAYADTLTGADNFVRFSGRLARRQDGEPDYSLAALNISQFKFINGLFGRAQADQLLCFVKGVLDENLRAGEFFCRDSADIFYLCLNETDRQAIRVRLEKVMREISKTAMGDQSNFQVLTYCGVAIAREAGEKENVLTQVLFALENARNLRRNNICFYDDSLRKDEELEYYIESHMHKALEEGEFKLYFQPKVDLRTDRVAGAETLVRWATADGRILLPGKFIPLFEKNGFCEELDMYVFENVCRQIRQWMDAGVEPMRVSINQTKTLFYRKGYVESLCALVDRYGVDPRLITLEILEGLAMENMDELNAVIAALHAKGFEVSMDDFGTGYSSLNTLANLRIDELKLDKGFLKTLSEGAGWRLRVVMEQTLTMARKLGIHTVVEGVESEEGHRIVHGLGCDMGQGYFYGSPMSADVFCKKFLKPCQGETDGM